MKFKHLASGAVVASLSFSPLSPMTRPAAADSGDVMAGLIVGAIIGGAVASEKGKSKAKSKSKTKSTKSKAKSSTPAISAEQKAANVDVQEALNHFGWTVGTADGSLGPKSKAAIKEYQAFMGYPVTGELTEQQRSVLVTAHHRSEAGGTVIAEIVSGSVYGLRGVLVAQAEEMAPAAGTMAAAGPIATEPGLKPGAVAAAAAAAIPALLPEDDQTVEGPAAPIKPSAPVVTEVIPSAPVVTPVVAPVIAPESTVPTPVPLPATAPAPTAPPVVEEAAAPEAAPETETADATGPGLPTFLASGSKEGLSGSCNSVAMQTAVNGAPVSALTLENAGLALDEQFCAARIEAVATSDALTAQVQGFTPEQIAQQCDALAPALKEHVAALSSQPLDEVLAGVKQFVLASGMSPDQLTGTAQVCLGVGYKTDKADVAIGSALLLTGMGQDGYAELLGFHLARGQGAALRPDLAESWYEISASAADHGGGVYGAGDLARAGMLVDAAYALNGHGPATEPALPSFIVAPAPEAAPIAAAPAIAAPEPAPLPAPLTAVEATPAPLPAAPGGDAELRVEGPGADAIRMGAEFARAALTGTFMAAAGLQ